MWATPIIRNDHDFSIYLLLHYRSSVTTSPITITLLLYVLARVYTDSRYIVIFVLALVLSSFCTAHSSCAYGVVVLH
jgi:hypothetical protein